MTTRVALVAAVASLLLIVGVAASLSVIKVDRLPPASEQGLPRSPAPSAAAPTTGQPDATTARHSKPPPPTATWAFWVVVALACLIVITTIVLTLWFLRRDTRRVYPGGLDPGPVPTFGRSRQEVLSALDAGLSDLADNGDPRRVVIACWLRLEHAAAAAGTPRQVGDVPGELVTRLLARDRVSSILLAQLADLYRAARYGTRPVDAAMRDQARSALGELRAELTASVRSAHPVPAGGPHDEPRAGVGGPWSRPVGPPGGGTDGGIPHERA